MRVLILGLGLIGGSLALALRRSPAFTVLGADRRATLHGMGELVDQPLAIENEPAVHRAAAEVDVVVLASPVKVIAAEMPKLLEHARTVTDCGSTKREIARAASASSREAFYVPGHPMAGGPDGGAAHARADLFEGRSWILCPEGRAAEAVTTVQEMVVATGANPTTMTIAQHDQRVALTSHLPQLLGSALRVLADEAGALDAAGPNFARLTKTGGASPSMWADVLETNRDELAHVIGALQSELDSLKAALLADPPDMDRVMALIRKARSLRHSAD